MGEPVRVSVIALDPILEAGATSALNDCPDVAVVPPQDPAAVSVMIVDKMVDQAFDMLRALRDQPRRPEVVIAAADLAPAEALHAIAAGARGLLRRRETGTAGLARAVLAVAGGDCTVPPDMLAQLFERGPRSLKARDLGPWSGFSTGSGLSDRERAVLALIADGRETDEIARELCYSPRTVVGVVHDITHRFRLRNRAHAVAYAMRAGLL
ncbi:MAG TPA: response regulator transcription factor [Actinocrinis sp.]|jgi:DNA-binding NarL/FixJ family response regulator